MDKVPTYYFTNQTVDRKMARDIELWIEDELGWELVNPFYDGDAREVQFLDNQNGRELSHEEIVGMDVKKIRNSRGIVALMTSPHDIGSCMEIAVASYAWGKPVYVIAMTERHFNHPWINYFANKVFRSPLEFIAYFKENKG